MAKTGFPWRVDAQPDNRPTLLADRADVHMGAKSLNFDPESVPHGGCLREVVRFLRGRYAGYNQADCARNADLQFCCVDLKLGPTEKNTLRGGSIQLFFLKESLYLVGWTIDNERDYIKVGDDRIPQPGRAVRRNDGKGFPVEHLADASLQPLGKKALEDALGELHDFLKAMKAGKKLDHTRYKLPFSLVVRMTAEMARFGAYFEDFLGSWWPGGWSQSQKITEDLPPFSEVINLWDKILRQARDNTGMPQYREDGVLTTLSQEACKAIVGDGVQLRADADAKKKQ
ncbi:hypothetical protein [Nonomuraea typhae]|uniref:Uncharacterized protein n=1 Tax=Nonomuraea typhae TaxID=2603600 RepID=A0ABW7YQK5_9ACTN